MPLNSWATSSEAHKLKKLNEIASEGVKQQIYIDTSVWGGVFDKDFLFETALLFDLVKTMQMTCLYSEITETELIKAPNRVRAFFEGFPQQLKKKVEITSDTIKLAETYVFENPKYSFT